MLEGKDSSLTSPQKLQRKNRSTDNKKEPITYKDKESQDTKGCYKIQRANQFELEGKEQGKKKESELKEKVVTIKKTVKGSKSQKEITKGSSALMHKKAIFNTFSNTPTKIRNKRYKMTGIEPQREEVKAENEKILIPCEEIKQQRQSNVLVAHKGNSMIDTELHHFAAKEGSNERKPFTYNTMHVSIAYNIHMKSNNPIYEP